LSRSTSAGRLRHYAALSNELHQEYLANDSSRLSYTNLIALQEAYFLPRYDDLRERPGFDAAIDFVVADLTGTGIAKRDRDLAKVVPLMSRALPERAVAILADAVELNAFVLEINLGIEGELRELLVSGSDVSERDYCVANREVSDLEAFTRIMEMARQAGEALDHVIRLPMIYSLMRGMRIPARLSGFGDFHAFLEKGYRTFMAVDDVPAFLDSVERRMTEIFERVFVAPVGALDHRPIDYLGPTRRSAGKGE